ncbi:MAG: PHB depolymerase family esterase [Bradymonadia bacterium]
MSKPASLTATALTALVAATLMGTLLSGCGDVTTSPYGPADEAPPATGERQSAMNGAGQYMRVANFGANPGELAMYFYVPSPAPQGPAPLVLGLHGCSQNAGNYRSAGWERLADEHGFYVLYPEQNFNNNAATCFNWGGEFGEPDNIERGDGENQSIINMINWAIDNHSVDQDKVFITGFSGGGAMTALMLATWPDVFAAGAPIAGIPYLCYDPPGGAAGEANYDPEVRTCLSPGKDFTPQVWGDYVRRANPNYDGPLPWVSIWQGSSDFTVATRNQTELYDQWSNVHGINADINAPSETNNVGSATQKVFNNGEGQGVIEVWSYNAGHTVPLGDECPPSGFGLYFSNVGVCSTLQIARFFGITGEGGGPGGGGGGGDRTPPTVNITAPASGTMVSGNVVVSADADDNVGVTEVTFKANGQVIGTANSAPWQITWDASNAVNGDYTLTAEALDAAGNMGVDADTQVTVSGGAEDNTPPEVTLTSPRGGSEIAGLAPIVAEATDNNSVARVEFFAGSDPIGTANSEPFTVSWDVTAVDPGPYTLTAVAYDAAGNSTTSDPVEVTVATPAATAEVGFVGLAEGADVSGPILTIEVEVTPNPAETPVSGVLLYWITPEGEQGLGIDRVPPYTFDWDVRNVELGPKDLVARAFTPPVGTFLGQSEITVNLVEEGAAGGAGGGAAGAGGAGGGGTAGAGGEATDEGPRKVGKEYWGCSASAHGKAPWGAVVLGLMLLGLRRRQRSRQG